MKKTTNTVNTLTGKILFFSAWHKENPILRLRGSAFSLTRMGRASYQLIYPDQIYLEGRR